MSNLALTHVWATSKAKGSTLLVLVAIADAANDDGECYPGQTRLAEKCRMSDRYLRECLSKLEALGEIEIITHGGIETKSGKTNRYKVLGVPSIDHAGRNKAIEVEDTKGGTIVPVSDEGWNHSSGHGWNHSSDEPKEEPKDKNIQPSTAKAVMVGDKSKFAIGQTVYALSKDGKRYVACTVVRETAVMVMLRWTNGSTVKEFRRKKNDVHIEKPKLKTLEDFTPRQQVVMRWVRNVKPGEGVPGKTVALANTVLSYLDDRFGLNGNSPDNKELDQAWLWAEKQGLSYRDPEKIPSMVNDYRDNHKPKAAPKAQQFTYNPAAPTHPCNNGMVVGPDGKSHQCPICAGVGLPEVQHGE